MKINILRELQDAGQDTSISIQDMDRLVKCSIESSEELLDYISNHPRIEYNPPYLRFKVLAIHWHHY